jgi:hypothetical protein
MPRPEPPAAFGPEHAAAYDQRYAKLAPMRDALHLLTSAGIEPLQFCNPVHPVNPVRTCGPIFNLGSGLQNVGVSAGRFFGDKK